MKRLGPLLLGSLLVAAPAQAQSPLDEIADRPPLHRALAAGYKALTVCSALKTAEEAGGARTLASVEANELSGIYAELDPIVGKLTAEISPTEVRVAWDKVSPPRIASYRPGQGCVIQPIGYVAGNDMPPVARAPHGPDFPEGPVQGDKAGVDAVIQSAFDGAYGKGARTTAVVILQNGQRVAEVYADGFGPYTPQRTWSVAKSLGGTLIGAAVQRGEIRVTDGPGIQNWQRPGDPRAAIRIEDLMRMASGLTSDTAGNRTDNLYFGGISVEEQATGWPMLHPPSTRFRYANNDTLLATKALEAGFAENPPARFLDRLGMTRTYAETDWRGGYVLSSQVWSTARDLSRLGQLYLNDGVWEGERLLPEGWRSFVSSRAGPQPETGDLGYGATFWIMDRSDGVPSDTFSANGARGQYVVIIPSRQIVIVRRAEDPAGQGFDIVGFTRDLLSKFE